MIDDANQNPAAGDHRENKTATSRFSEYKTKIIGSTPTDSNKLDTEAAIPLKKFINLRKSFDFSLINCEIELDLRWSRNYGRAEIYSTPENVANPNAGPPTNHVSATWTTSAKFQINRIKFHVPAVPLSVNNNIRFYNLNMFYVFSFKYDPTNSSQTVEIKDFNALIDNKPFFDQPVKQARK